MNKKLYGLWFLCVFSFIGVVYTGVFIHEMVHVYDAQQPLSLCYDFGDEKRLAHVSYVENGEDVGEFKAYFVSSIFTLVLLFILSNFMFFYLKDILEKK